MIAVDQDRRDAQGIRVATERATEVRVNPLARSQKAVAPGI